MKKHTSCPFVSIPALILLAVFTVSAQNSPLSADNVIRKTITRLASLKTVAYDYRRELNYASEKFFHELKAHGYLDLTSADKLLGARYRFDKGANSTVFNGSERFALDGKNKIIRVDNKPTSADLGSDSYLVNSPLTLKNVLPRILADASIPRSVSEARVGDKDFYVIEFSLDKFGIDLYGNFATRPLVRKITYRVTVSKESFMPVGVLQRNGDVDFIKTDFAQIDENPAAPPENEWYYSTYLASGYKPAEPPKDALLKPGTPAPDFTLPSTAKTANVSLSDYRGKLVLLEFWIFHCGACIAAVPGLNSINKKYGGKNMEVAAVNIYDSKELVDLFIRSKDAQYPVLYQGEEAAEKFGVKFYPTAVLIGRDGKVIFSGIFDAEKIDALIAANLSK